MGSRVRRTLLTLSGGVARRLAQPPANGLASLWLVGTAERTFTEVSFGMADGREPVPPKPSLYKCDFFGRRGEGGLMSVSQMPLCPYRHSTLPLEEILGHKAD
jgi:hypothetical protein